jgi:flagellar FliJ protein
MPQFHFKLQKVLEAKRSFEDNAKREFGAAQRELMKQEEILRNNIDTRECFLDEMSERRAKGDTVRQFRDDVSQEWGLKRTIREQRFRVGKAEKEKEKKREKLIQKMKDRKIMEKLRERKFEDFKELIETEEHKFSDEVGGRRAHYSEKVISSE